MTAKKKTVFDELIENREPFDPKKAAKRLKKLQAERIKREDEERADRLAAARKPPMYFGPIKRGRF